MTKFPENQSSLELVAQWFLVPQGLAVAGAERATGCEELQALKLKGSASRGFQIERLFKYLPNNSHCALEQAAGALAESWEVQAFDRNMDESRFTNSAFLISQAASHQ